MWGSQRELDRGCGGWGIVAGECNPQPNTLASVLCGFFGVIFGVSVCFMGMDKWQRSHLGAIQSIQKRTSGKNADVWAEGEAQRPFNTRKSIEMIRVSAVFAFVRTIYWRSFNLREILWHSWWNRNKTTPRSSSINVFVCFRLLSRAMEVKANKNTQTHQWKIPMKIMRVKPANIQWKWPHWRHKTFEAENEW